MAALRKLLVFIAIISMFQALCQMVFSALGLFQYFCIIDFLRDFPLLVYIKVLYFHNPRSCGPRINIGQSIDGIPNQAFVLLEREPLTATRTFIINSISLIISLLWLIACGGLLRTEVNNKGLQCWSWIIVTVAVSGLDLVATVTYANDSFHTQTLSEMMEFIGGSANGTGNMDLNTAMTAWAMVIVYSRFVILFFLNIIFIICVIIKSRTKHVVENTVVIEAPPPEIISEVNSGKDDEEIILPSETPTQILPRPGLRQSYRDMKTQLFGESAQSLPNSLDISHERSQNVNTDKKQILSFTDYLVSLSHKFENMLVEQQKRLDKAGLNSSQRTTQSTPQQATTSTDRYRRRDTATKIQGQMPWAYIPASGQPMRDQLPSDEDLPPVPLPDYTIVPSYRKASVHRAGSSLSSLTHLQDKKLRTQFNIRQ